MSFPGLRKCERHRKAQIPFVVNNICEAKKEKRRAVVYTPASSSQKQKHSTVTLVFTTKSLVGKL